VLPQVRSRLNRVPDYISCFTAPTRKSVHAFHQAAIRQGGSDNGKPGLRAGYGTNYYAAFVIDPDGYRIEAYCGKAA
jgi:predicted lactoylglutathione lyase